MSRPDRHGAHRVSYSNNRQRILASQNTCGICGRPVDKSLKQGNPMAPTIDHIIPIAKGGHPSSLDNLQLAHWSCNRQKSDKLYKNKEAHLPKVLGNRVLPQSRDWVSYRCQKT